MRSPTVLIPLSRNALTMRTSTYRSPGQSISSMGSRRGYATLELTNHGRSALAILAGDPIDGAHDAVIRGKISGSGSRSAARARWGDIEYDTMRPGPILPGMIFVILV